MAANIAVLALHKSGSLLCLLLIFLVVKKGICDKIENKIYMSLKNFQPCVLLTNATHQIGCTSKMNGNTGTVHFIKSDDDLEWLLKKGPHIPYCPLVTSDMFTEELMRKLMDSKKISGAMVINAGKFGAAPAAGFSPDVDCPLDNFGMYKDNKNYQHCKKVKWNYKGNGMSFVYYGIPIFALSDEGEVNKTIECYEKFNVPVNGNPANYPLCGVEMKDFMFAAKDTPTCRRKTDLAPYPVQFTYCDPLGDWNVWGTLYPMTSQVHEQDVILLAARLDSTGFFHELAPGADNDVTGIVTLLAVARALGDLKRHGMATNTSVAPKRPIIFSFFNGEVWDYIGSSRMVYDMNLNAFPYGSELPSDCKEKNDTCISKISLHNIGYFLELSQLGILQDNSLWAHSDPVSTDANSGVADRVKNMFNLLKTNGEKVGVNLGNASATVKSPLPPASLQSFLKFNKSIAGIVLADHRANFTNRFYNSRFDDPQNINLTSIKVNDTFWSMYHQQPEHLAKVAEAVATTVYTLANDGKPPPIPLKADSRLIGNLLYCFVYSANCPGFYESLSISHKKKYSLPNQPFSRYISVAQLTNHITEVVYSVLAHYTGEWVDSKVCDKNRAASLPYATSYTKISPGNGTLCVRYNVYKTDALSPAFILHDYDTREYSTWAESMWKADIGIRLFLFSSSSFEGGVFGAGLAMFVVGFLVTLFCSKKADLLLTPNSTGFRPS